MSNSIRQAARPRVVGHSVPSHSKRQLALPFVASRKPRRAPSAATGVPHRVRPRHCHRHPVHVTLRRARGLPSLREEALFLAFRGALHRTGRSWFRVVQFSVQANHVHMIVEATDGLALSRGMTGLTVRLARALNRALGRRGGVWSERYHARALPTPREVRNAFVYVLMNRHKHDIKPNTSLLQGFDPCSSAWWFDGWSLPPSSGPPWPTETPPVVRAKTWLAQAGWKRHGLIRTYETPRGARARA
jgi:putative transposase